MSDELSIVTVSYFSKELLLANYELLLRLNPIRPKQWLIVDNAFENLEQSELSQIKEFQIVPGVPRPSESPGYRSLHHALAIEKAIRLVSTRFVLIMDPDFFVIYSDWISEISKHVNSKKLAFFGAPWNPSHFLKFRYFPCVHFLWIDSQQVPIHHLDFKPDIGWSDQRKRWIRRIPMLRRFERNCFVGISRDTGYRIHQKYAGKKPVECLTPVLLSAFLEKLNEIDVSPRRLRRFLPDRLSILPKRSESYLYEGFLKEQKPELHQAQCEEFLWQNKPFGVHFREVGSRKQKTDVGHLLSLIKTLH